MPETPEKTSSPSGTLVDGLACTEAIDKSGEKLLVEGADISSLEDGEGVVTWEHRGPDSPGAGPDDVIGRIVYVKKLLRESDCSNERELKYWKTVELPCIYFVARLADAAGVPSAVAAAGHFRDYAKNREKHVLRWSVEGSTLSADPDDKKVLKETIIRAVTLTLKPCNASAVSGLLLDGSPPPGYERNPEGAPAAALKNAGVEDLGKSLRRQLAGHDVADDAVVVEEYLAKAISAGSYNAAPGSLVGGAALQREYLVKTKNRAKAALRDWDRSTPFREFLKHRLPEADPSFLDRFAGMVETHQLTRSQALLGKGEKPSGLTAPPRSRAPAGEGQLTVRGKPVRSSTAKDPTFDEQKGVLHTPRGQIKVYVPSDDHPKHRESFHAAMSDPKSDEIFSRAAKNWRRVNRALRAGKLPEEVPMHAALFSHLSPNTPVPYQELMYGHLVDEMNARGVDARAPGFASAVGPGWLARDNPSDFPKTGAQHFERIAPAVQIRNDSKLTSRRAGDIGSFMLPANKLENMGRYAAMHAGLVGLVRKHGTDMRSAARELMEHKVAYGAHQERRKKALASGRPDPGEFPGIPVAGLAPKTTRYMLGMLGGGNGVVPDTHFVRYLFGLDRDKDQPTIDYLKSVLWNDRNAPVLEGLDRYYARRHDAVQHLLEQPEWADYRGNPESVVFPAFWRNWMAIVPHENARGMGTHGFNEGTDHMPYWEAIQPILQKYRIPASWAKSEQDLGPLPQRTAGAMEEVLRRHGEVPAQLVYWAYLVPALLGDHDRSAVQKFEALSVDLRKAASELAAKVAPVKVVPDELSLGDKRVKPGHAEVGGKPYTLLDAGEHGYTAVPQHLAISGEWGPSDLVKYPRGTPGLAVHRDPELLDAGQTVDAAVHGHALNSGPEQRALIHGLDFARPATGQSTGTWAARRSHWRKGPAGSVFVKAAESEEKPGAFSEARKEAAYHNLARDFFGLGQFVPTVALLRHPRTGREHAVIQQVAGEPASVAPWGALAHPEHRETLKRLDESGDLDKVGVMNLVLGNDDRHGMNYMFDRDGGLKLIDHGLAFRRNNHFSVGYPGYYDHLNPVAADQDLTALRPSAVEWVKGLDPAKFDASLRANGVPDEERESALYRLNNLREHLKHRPTLTRRELFASPAFDASQGVRFD